MEASEKARELVEKFKPLVTTWDCYNDIPIPDETVTEDAKQCALIAVDEIIAQCDSKEVVKNTNHWYSYAYWQQVKTEIKNI